MLDLCGIYYKKYLCEKIAFECIAFRLLAVWRNDEQRCDLESSKCGGRVH